ncbi:MAG: pyridoxamine kinase [Clostridiales bacterium]|nr:pyridoxamine kinase [Clostridiales bacterium]
MRMTRQKRVAVINDVTGFGRCSAAVAQPIISAMKIQCCVVPTAILSVHTGFPDYFLHDFTPYLKTYVDNWERTGISFDGIASGFIGSKEQIDIVVDFFERFKKEETLVVVDPVMGDYGKLYSSYTDELCHEMKRLLPRADVLTPNLTEACRLLDLDYHSADISQDALYDIADGLSEMGPDRVVITGLQQGAQIFNYVYEKNKNAKLIAMRKIGGDRSGTGDVFSSVVTGALIQGDDFETAVRRAIRFLDKAIAYTAKQELPWNYGICFEEYLDEL